MTGCSGGIGFGMLASKQKCVCVMRILLLAPRNRQGTLVECFSQLWDPQSDKVRNLYVFRYARACTAAGICGCSQETWPQLALLYAPDEDRASLC